MKRESTAVWKGTGKDGKGHLSSASQVLDNTQYSWSSRFAEGTGTNPEELIAAALAGCYAMKLSFILDAEGYTEKQLEVKGQVTIKEGKIEEPHLLVSGRVAGISNENFQKSVQEAKASCPVSVLLGNKITVEAELEQ